jgi:hypothetical protein
MTRPSLTRRRWRMLAPPLIALVMLTLAPALTRAGYQGTVDVNDTAFDPVCLGFEDSYPEKMIAAATAGYRQLGYATTSFTGKAFTRAQVLSRTPADWGYYVHSHGDRYLNADGRRYSGFREDSGDCVQSVVFSKDIAAKRAGRQSNLVMMSTCYLGNADTTMPAAFAIAKDKALALEWNGPEFYVGYVGLAWDSDEWIFEARFWDALADGRGVGAAFDLALSRGGFGHAFDADWWGSYYWSGRAGPGSTCTNCS